VTNQEVVDPTTGLVTSTGTISAYAAAFASASEEDDADADARARAVEQEVEAGHRLCQRHQCRDNPGNRLCDGAG
jgi:hypothetical protein